MDKMQVKGIDVSRYQGKINWQGVKNDGIEFTMVQTGYGDIISNPRQVDPQFSTNALEADKAGVNVGAYHFSYAKDEQEAIKEAKGVLELLKSYRLTMPVAYDYEYDSERVTGKLSVSQLTDVLDAFLRTIEEAGYYAMLYANLDYLQNRLDMSRLSRYDLWYARPGVTEPDRNAGLWQYGQGSVTGIPATVDLNYAFADYPNIIRSAGLNHLSQAPVQPPVQPPVQLPVAASYTVKKGDTMSGIAASQGVTLQQLMNANPQVGNPNLINVGQKITIPGKNSSVQSALGTVTQDGVRLRAMPENGIVLGLLYRNQTFRILSESNGWVKADRAGTLGWISSDYVKRI